MERRQHDCSDSTLRQARRRRAVRFCGAWEEARSGNTHHPTVCVQERTSIGPPIEQTQDRPASRANQPPWRVPEAPAQRLGFGDAKSTTKAAELEPPHQIGGEPHRGEPRRVGVKVGEGEPLQAGIFEPRDVVLDVGMGTHEAVEFHRAPVAIGVEAPEAVIQRGEEAGLRTGMERFPTHNQTRPRGPAGQLAELGQLGHRGTLLGLTVLAHCGLPPLLVLNRTRDRGVNSWGRIVRPR